MVRRPSDFWDWLWSMAIPEPNSGCWLWTGGLNHNGYAQVKVGSLLDGSKRGVMAHIYTYEKIVEEVPVGLELDHTCRVRCCVNPDHLEPVTRRENLLRSIAFRAVKTHCPCGHDYQDHGHINGQGYMECRTCRNKQSMLRERAKRALKKHGR